MRGGGCTLLEELGEGVAAGRVDRLELLDLVESVDVFVLKLDRHEVRVVVQSQTHRALHTTRSRARGRRTLRARRASRIRRRRRYFGTRAAAAAHAPWRKGAAAVGGGGVGRARASDHLAPSRAADLFDLALFMACLSLRCLI